MPSLRAEIEQLTIAERIQLVEDIWDSIAAEAEEVPITEAQRRELDRRVEAYRQNPEGGVSWDDALSSRLCRRAE
jgi:putative addiction module component (TIGR02574 family)